MSQCKHAEHALAPTRRVSRDSPLRCRRLRDWLRRLQRWGVRHRLSRALRAPLLAAGQPPAPLKSLRSAARRSPSDAAPPATGQSQRVWLEVPLQSLVLLPAGAALVQVLPPTAAVLLEPRTQPAAELPSAEPLRCLRPAGLIAALHRLACRSAGNASCAAESDCSTTSRQCTLFSLAPAR